jgi:VanZ family protein
MSPPFLNRQWSATLGLALIGAFLVIGWWPFAPFPRNRVEWLAGRPGLAFQPPGVAFSSFPLALNESGPAEGFTLELHLAAGAEPRSNTHHIATFHVAGQPSGLILLQWKSELILRIPDPLAPRGFREVGVNALQKQSRIIAITCDATGTTFYVDGRPTRRFPRFLVPSPALRGRLILGDAAEGKHGWTGQLFGFAIHQRAINRGEAAARFHAWKDRDAAALRAGPRLAALYLFEAGSGSQVASLIAPPRRIEIPTIYSVVEKSAFLTPRDLKTALQAGRQDIIVNFLGFIPLGFLACIYACQRPRGSWMGAITFAILAGGLVSLLIEGGQIWLPNRVSSALDFGCNTLGGATGAVLALAVWRGLSGRKATGA